MLTWMTLVLMSVQLARKVSAHGKLTAPASRNVIDGAAGCAHCLNTGGPCGDGSAGKFLDYYDGPQATWTAGSIVPITVEVTAHHRGHYEFRICDEILNSNVANPEACLNKWVLERASPAEAGFTDCQPGDERAACVPFDPKHPERWYLPPSGEVSLIHTIYFKVPAGLQCQECTLQWHWWSANSCIPAGDYGCYKDVLQLDGYWVGSKAAWWTAGQGSCSGPSGPNGHSGCGEQFWNCADITVLPSGGIPTPTPTPAPSSSAPAPVPATTTTMTTTTKAPATTTSPAAVTTTMIPSKSCTAVNGAEKFGASHSRCVAVCDMLPAGQWPCGAGHACDCSTTVSSSSTTMAMSTEAPTTSTTETASSSSTTMAMSTEAPTTSTTETAVSTTEAGTGACFKTRGLQPNGATDENCAACTSVTIWPCNGVDWATKIPICTCSGSLVEVSSHSFATRPAKGQRFLGTSLLQDGVVTAYAEAIGNEPEAEL